MCVTYISLPQYILNKIHKLVMASGRLCYGSYGYKERCSKILRTNNFLTYSQLMYKAVAKLTLKLAHYKQPISLTEQVYFPDRQCKPVRLVFPPSTAFTRKYNYLNKIWSIYNELPNYLKNENINLKCRLKQLDRYVGSGFDRCWLRVGAPS